MEKQSVSTSESPKVVLDIQGDLTLKGTDELEVIVKSDADDVFLETQNDQIIVRCPSDCKVKVPRRAQILIIAVHGDAALKALEGPVKVQDSHGDLTFRSVGPVELESAHGNLTVRNVMGDLKIQTVAGNVTIRDIQGAFGAEDIRGNLVVGDVDGDIAASAQGNVVLNLDPSPGNEYDLKAKGNIVCNLPPDASVVIEIERAIKIVASLPNISCEKPTKAPCSLTLGEGDAKLHLSAGGNVVLSEQLPDFEPFSGMNFNFVDEFSGMAESIGEQITQQIEAQMQSMEQQLDNLSENIGAAGLSPEQLERIQQRARETGERAVARAQEKLAQAQEKLERKMAAVQQRADQKARAAEARVHRTERHAWGEGGPHRHERRSWGFNWPGVPQPPGVPAAPEESINEEERLAVLRMLEQKKITPEEAEMLLSALEGKEG